MDGNTAGPPACMPRDPIRAAAQDIGLTCLRRWAPLVLMRAHWRLSGESSGQPEAKEGSTIQVLSPGIDIRI